MNFWNPQSPETKHLRVFDLMRFFYGGRQAMSTFFFLMHCGLKMHSPTKISAGHPQRWINTSAWVHPPLWLSYSQSAAFHSTTLFELLFLFFFYFVEDSPAVPLAKRLAEKPAGVHQLLKILAIYYFPQKGDASIFLPDPMRWLCKHLVEKKQKTLLSNTLTMILLVKLLGIEHDFQMVNGGSLAYLTI